MRPRGKISVKNISWDGNSIQCKLDSSIDSKEFFKILISKRNGNQEKVLKFKYKAEKNNLIIPLKQLSGLKKGKWDFFVEFNNNKANKKRIGLYNAPIASTIMRYLKPIVNVGQYSIIPFLTVKNGLSIHCGNLLNLEDISYDVVPRLKKIEKIQESQTKISIKFKEPVTINGKDTRLIMKNKDTVVIVPIKKGFNQKEIIMEKKSLKPIYKENKWNIYFQNTKGNIVERFSLDYYVKLKNQNITFNKKQVVEKQQPTSRGLFKGQIYAENLKIQDKNITFAMNKGDIKYPNQVKFYIKKRRQSEKIYVDYQRVQTGRKEQIKIPIAQLSQVASTSRWDLFVELYHDHVLERRRVGQYNNGNINLKKEKVRGYSLTTNELGVSPYLTQDNELSFYFCKEEQYINSMYPATAVLHQLSMSKGGILKLSASIKMEETNDFVVESVSLRLRNDKSKIIETPCLIKDSKEVNTRKIKAEIDIKDLTLEQFYWDFYVSVKLENNTKRYVRLINDNFFINKRLKHGIFKYTLKTKDSYIIYPYITLNNGLSLTYRQMGEFEDVKYKINEYTAYLLYIIFYWYFNWKPVWLIHEKYSETAQDNSFYFFKYSYENHYDRKIYYVIKKGSPDEKNLMPYKNRVVYFMSVKHLLLLLGSKLFISSETKGHGYAWRVSRGVIRKFLDEKKYVFLQHGILGLKRVENTFKVNSTNEAELFVVSSDFEKDIVKNYFGYSEENIIVTGLSRWDAIEIPKSQPERKEIFLMPTWRNWLEEVEEEQFVLSDYYQQYNSLIQSKKLSQLLKENNLILNFYVHPKFMPYVENFSSSHEYINIIQFGEAKINDLIMRSSLLITDYSSVAWEAYYQKKPVLFFHFDLDKYEENQGSYMDLKNEIFGDVAYDSSELVELLSHYIDSGFKEKEEFQIKRHNYFKFVDHNNSSRIYSEILKREETLTTSDSLLISLKKNHFIRAFWRKYKRSPLVSRFGGYFINLIK